MRTETKIENRALTLKTFFLAGGAHCMYGTRPVFPHGASLEACYILLSKEVEKPNRIGSCFAPGSNVVQWGPTGRHAKLKWCASTGHVEVGCVSYTVPCRTDRMPSTARHLPVYPTPYHAVLDRIPSTALPIPLTMYPTPNVAVPYRLFLTVHHIQ